MSSGGPTGDPPPDVNAIGAKLQSLLRIPPIERPNAASIQNRQPAPVNPSARIRGFVNSNPSGRSRSFTNSNRRGRSNEHEQSGSHFAGAHALRPNQTTNLNTTSTGLNNLIPNEISHSQNAAGGGSENRKFTNDPAPPDLLHTHSVPVEQASEPNRLPKFNYNAGGRNAEHFPARLMKRPSNPSLNTSGSSSGSTGSSSPRRDFRPSVMQQGAQLRQLLQKPECPDDIKLSIDTLMAASVCESRPNFVISDLEKPVLDLLRVHHIEPLKKKSPKFARAKYWCSICNYHMDTIFNVINHIANVRHYKNAKKVEMVSVVESIVRPSVSHQQALTHYVFSILREHGLSNLGEREGIVSRLNNEIGERLGCSFTLFGSSLSGFGFRDADVNINLSFGNSHEFAEPLDGTEHVNLLKKIYELLIQAGGYEDVRESFSSMLLIHFFDRLSLKRCVIHVNNTSGVLLAKLFTEYSNCDERVRPIVVAFRHIAKLAEIDNQNEGSLPSHCYSILAIHFLQVCGVLPILHQFVEAELDDTRLSNFASAREASLVWKTRNNDSIGLLWASLLQYYAVEFLRKDEVVSISRMNVSRKSDSAWNRKLSIQDPILPRSNLSRSLCSNKICEYIMDRMKTAYAYFGIPRSITGPLYYGTIPQKHVKESDVLCFEKYILGFGSINGPLIPEDKSHERKPRYVNRTNYRGRAVRLAILEDTDLLGDWYSESEYRYELDQANIQDGEEPPRICKSCGVDGHLKRDCPDETIPPLKPVRLPSKFTLNVLTETMIRNFEYAALNEEDVQTRLVITSEIHSALENVYPDLDLCMFGSTYNGFGLHFSDVDICLRFKNNPINKATITQDEVNQILTTIADNLKEQGYMESILPIPSAKVPIVKFVHRKSQLEGDISLSNILALHNTRMLRTYCLIDKRLKVLGCFLKKVTKICDISDASKGSLSSYGLVLMMIHFLQQHNPPVLPVLQELPGKTTHIVEGCDVWFFDDLQNLPHVWEHCGRNHETVGQLWLAFLKYYTEVFDFEKCVIQISQKNIETRFNKLWLSDTAIAIEDPFDRSHNLGAGLSRRMGVYIIKSFQRFREVFHVSVDYAKSSNWPSYFLNPRRLRGGTNPPIDRQCRICSRIGHFARNCTFYKRNEDHAHIYSEDDALDDVKLDEEMGEARSFELEEIREQEYEEPSELTAESSQLERFPILSNQANSTLAVGSNRPQRVVGTNDGQNENNETSEMSDMTMQLNNALHLNNNPEYISAQNQLEPLHGIRFHGNVNAMENGDIERMISHNPGVLFQNPLVSSTFVTVPNTIGTINNLHFTAAGRPVYAGVVPPPGFQGPLPVQAVQYPILGTGYVGVREEHPPMSLPSDGSSYHIASFPHGTPPPGFQPMSFPTMHPQVSASYHQLPETDLPPENTQRGVLNDALPETGFPLLNDGLQFSDAPHHVQNAHQILQNPPMHQILQGPPHHIHHNPPPHLIQNANYPMTYAYAVNPQHYQVQTTAPMILANNGDMLTQSTMSNTVGVAPYLMTHSHHGPVVTAMQHQPNEMMTQSTMSNTVGVAPYLVTHSHHGPVVTAMQHQPNEMMTQSTMSNTFGVAPYLVTHSHHGPVVTAMQHQPNEMMTQSTMSNTVGVAPYLMTHSRHGPVVTAMHHQPNGVMHPQYQQVGYPVYPNAFPQLQFGFQPSPQPQHHFMADENLMANNYEGSAEENISAPQEDFGQ